MISRLVCQSEKHHQRCRLRHSFFWMVKQGKCLLFAENKLLFFRRIFLRWGREKNFFTKSVDSPLKKCFNIAKPMRRGLNQKTNLQRAGVAENPADDVLDKWTAEGGEERRKPSISRRRTSVSGSGMCWHSPEWSLSKRQSRWYRRCNFKHLSLFTARAGAFLFLPAPPNPSDLLHSNRWKHIKQDWRGNT